MSHHTLAPQTAQAPATAKSDPADLVKRIKTHIAKGDQAKEKSDQHYIAAGQYLAWLQADHAGSWSEWEELLKAKVGISTGRASELMQIADGRKTVGGLAAASTERSKKHRALSSLRNEEPPAEVSAEPEQPKVRASSPRGEESAGTFDDAELEPAKAKRSTNGSDPTTSAAAMKAKLAELDITGEPAEPRDEPADATAEPGVPDIDVRTWINGWASGSDAVREEFLQGASLGEVLKVMPPAWRPELKRRVLGQASAVDLVEALEGKLRDNKRAQKAIKVLLLILQPMPARLVRKSLPAAPATNGSAR